MCIFFLHHFQFLWLGFFPSENEEDEEEEDVEVEAESDIEIFVKQLQQQVKDAQQQQQQHQYHQQGTIAITNTLQPGQLRATLTTAQNHNTEENTLNGEDATVGHEGQDIGNYVLVELLGDEQTGNITVSTANADQQATMDAVVKQLLEETPHATLQEHINAITAAGVVSSGGDEGAGAVDEHHIEIVEDDGGAGAATVVAELVLNNVDGSDTGEVLLEQIDQSSTVQTESVV